MVSNSFQRILAGSTAFLIGLVFLFARGRFLGALTVAVGIGAVGVTVYLIGPLIYPWLLRNKSNIALGLILSLTLTLVLLRMVYPVQFTPTRSFVGALTGVTVTVFYEPSWAERIRLFFGIFHPPWLTDWKVEPDWTVTFLHVSVIVLFGSLVIWRIRKV